MQWGGSVFELLSSILAFISRSDPSAAERMTRQIVSAIRWPEVFLVSGRVVPEHGFDDFRKITVRPYRVISQRQDALIEIMTARHSARQLDDLPVSRPRAEGRPSQCAMLPHQSPRYRPSMASAHRAP